MDRKCYECFYVIDDLANFRYLVAPNTMGDKRDLWRLINTRVRYGNVIPIHPLDIIPYLVYAKVRNVEDLQNLLS